MLAMSALLAGAGRVGRGLAEEGGQDSDGAWWRRLPSGHTVDEAEPRRAPPSHRQIRGKTAVVNRKCGSGSSGSVRHRVSWRVHRCAGQEAQEHPAPTFSLSLWITVWSGIGVRLVMAMPRALVTSGVAWWLSIDQPTTRRENTSRTTQQYSLPSRMGCSVMSVTHNWSGAGRSKRRSTRSAAVALFALLRKVFRDPGSPCRP